MNTELQNKAWSALPKEFKEEVKDIFTEYSNTITKFSAVRSELINIFGIHNLTSDAEGEEMLTVKRSDVINEFDKLHKLSYKAADLQLGLNAFRTLFGSKCLPDENYSNVEKLEKNDEPKPAEPKFKVGDKVKAHYPYGDEIGHIQEVMRDGTYDVVFGGGCTGHGITEDMLEPYTEQKEEKSEHLHAESVENLQIADEESHLRNLSQETANCDKEFDTILKDGFRNERRLNIAAMAMQGLLANPNNNANLSETVADALNCADTLIAEVEKGNSDGED